MSYHTKRGLRGLLTAAALAVAAGMPMKAQAETTYNLALLSDFSGPVSYTHPTPPTHREG